MDTEQNFKKKCKCKLNCPSLLFILRDLQRHYTDTSLQPFTVSIN